MTTPYPDGLTLDLPPENAAEAVQLLDDDGARHDHPVFGPIAAALSDDALRDMYRHMALTRAFDTEATALQRKGELGLWASTLGQEGIQVGSGMAIAARDMIFPSYREHGVAQVRGLPLTDLLPVMRGISHGGWDPREHNFHTQTFVIGAHTLHAVGYAMGIQRDGDAGGPDERHNRAVVAYHGDGASSQGDVNEALVFAASAKAPTVFICQNNAWAISVPASVQSRTPLVRRAPGFGVPAVRVDGNDPIASYAVTAEALRRARAGEGPMYIEAVTYRMGAHTTSDDPTKYRSREEEDSWRARDPLARLATYLSDSGKADDAYFTQVAADCEELAAHTRAVCTSLRAGDPVEMFDHVYSDTHPQVDADRESFIRFESMFADSGTGAVAGSEGHVR